MRKMILDNLRITIKGVADDVGISFCSCQAIFTNVLCTKRAAVKIIPELQNFEEKQRRMDIGQKMLTAFSDDPDLINKSITGGESWLQSPIIPMESILLRLRR